MSVGLGAFLAFPSCEPAFARMCLVEVMAAGPDAVARRNGAIVGGVHEVVYSRVLRGEIRALPELLPDLSYSMLLPYVGEETALAERGRLENGAAATP